jgi:hypothetical protein
MDVDQIHVVGLQPLEAALHGFDDLRYGRVVGEVAVPHAELGGEEDLVAVPLDRLAEHALREIVRVVRRRVEIGNAALDGIARHLCVIDAAGAERDVRDHRVGASQAPVAVDARGAPLGTRLWGNVFHLGHEEVSRHRQPTAVAADRDRDAAGGRGHAGADAAQHPQHLAPRQAGEGVHRSVGGQGTEQPRRSSVLAGDTHTLAEAREQRDGRRDQHNGRHDSVPHRQQAALPALEQIVQQRPTPEPRQREPYAV